jgi:hypothetical protein
MGGYLMAPGGGYAWVIDIDHDHDRFEQELREASAPQVLDMAVGGDGVWRVEDPAEESRVGESGPHDAPDLLTRLLAEGKGRRWRTFYDVDYDGQPVEELLVHEGRYIDYADLVPDEHGDAAYIEVDSEAEFGPLRDFSLPDCGAVGIEYWTDELGKWEVL